MVDTVTPTVTATTSNSDVNVAHNGATVTFTFSEGPTDFGLAHVIATGGTLSNFSGSGTVYTATFTGNAGTDISNGKVSVDNAWHEGNGNAGSAGATGNFVVDTVTPTVTVAASNINAGNGTATVTFTFSEAPLTFALVDTSATGGVLSNLNGSGSVYTATFTSTGNGSGNDSVSVTAGSWQEVNGNAGGGGSASFTIGTVTPRVGASRRPGTSGAPASITTGHAVATGEVRRLPGPTALPGVMDSGLAGKSAVPICLRPGMTPPQWLKLKFFAVSCAMFTPVNVTLSFASTVITVLAPICLVSPMAAI